MVYALTSSNVPVMCRFRVLKFLYYIFSMFTLYPNECNTFEKVRPCSGEIDHLLKLQSVIVSKDGKERLLQIEESSPYPQCQE